MASEVVLRKVEPNDAALLLKWYTDFETTKFMSTSLRCQKYTLENIQKDILSNDPDLEHAFMICTGNKPQPIGLAGIDGIDIDDQRGEIYFLIGDKEERGKGLSKKIIRQILEYAFNELKLNSVLANATIENKPSVRALESSGFRKVGVMKEYNLIGGKFLDEAFFNMTYQDYQSLKLPAVQKMILCVPQAICVSQAESHIETSPVETNPVETNPAEIVVSHN